MKNGFVILSLIGMLVGNCGNPVKSENEGTKLLTILSTQTVNDTSISYGSYPNLPNTINVLLSDSTIKKIDVEWDLSIKTVVPGIYKAIGRYSIPDFGIPNDSMSAMITVKDIDSIKSFDSGAGNYLGGGYDSLFGNHKGQALCLDSMVFFEKPINQMQYISRVLQTENARIEFKNNIDAILGFQSNLCNTPLNIGEIRVVAMLVYRYKTYLLNDKLKFYQTFSDSLYKSNTDVFKQLYGNDYIQQQTLCRYHASEMDLIPGSMPEKDLSAEIIKIKNSLSLSSTNKMDLGKFSNPSGSSYQSSLSVSTDWNPWFFSKSTKQVYNDFKNTIDSCMTTCDYFASSPIYKSYW